MILVFSISEDGSTLTLNGAHTSDSGKYTCVATNPAGEEDRIFNLNVYGKFIGFYFLYFYCIFISIILSVLNLYIDLQGDLSPCCFFSASCDRRQQRDSRAADHSTGQFGQH